MDERILKFRESEKNYCKDIITNLRKNISNCKVAYLPSFIPQKPVDYILLAMEPSFGWWAKTEDTAENMVSNGFVNFLWSIDDFLFHFSINNFLSKSYYITDISKIAMTVENANLLREKMYPIWIEHLKKEIEIFGSEHKKIIFIGNKVEDWLSPKMTKFDVSAKIVHFSRQASSTRKKIALDNYEEYLEFCNSNDLSSERIKEFTYNLLKQYIHNDELINYIYKKIEKRDNFMTESRRQFVFSYYKAFNTIK